MAAKIWWQPPQARDVRVVALGRPLSQVDEYDQVDEAVSQAINGNRTRVVFSRTRAVEYTADLLTDYDRIRDLEALQSHLLRGGHCTVAEDATKCFGTFTDGLPKRGSTTLNYMRNMYQDYGGGYTPAANDILCLRGPSPELYYEEVEIASYSAGYTVTLSEAPLYRWALTQPWCYVRIKGFWPILRLQQGVTQILTTDRRINWRLSLPLEEPPNAYDRLTAQPADFPVTDVGSSGIDDAILQSGGFTPPSTGPWAGSTTTKGGGLPPIPKW